MSTSAQRTGLAHLPLHGEHAPAWLFQRMARLAREITADIVYGAPTSFRDPATYSFAHGGKDGYPFPVDRALYDQSIELLSSAVRRAKLGESEKRDAHARLRAPAPVERTLRT